MGSFNKLPGDREEFCEEGVEEEALETENLEEVQDLGPRGNLGEEDLAVPGAAKNKEDGGSPITEREAVGSYPQRVEEICC